MQYSVLEYEKKGACYSRLRLSFRHFSRRANGIATPLLCYLFFSGWPPLRRGNIDAHRSFTTRNMTVIGDGDWSSVGRGRTYPRKCVIETWKNGNTSTVLHPQHPVHPVHSAIQPIVPNARRLRALELDEIFPSAALLTDVEDLG